MPLNNHSNKESEGTLKTFERSLALYKARIYETYYREEANRRPLLNFPSVKKVALPRPTILVVEDHTDEIMPMSGF